MQKPFQLHKLYIKTDEAIDTIKVVAIAIVSAENRQQKSSSSSSSLRMRQLIQLTLLPPQLYQLRIDNNNNLHHHLLLFRLLGRVRASKRLVREAQKPNGAHVGANSYLAIFTSYKQVVAEMKALPIKKDLNHFNYHIYMNFTYSGITEKYRVTHSDGDVGQLNNGGADVVAVTILKCYHLLANNILGLALRIQRENKRLKFIDMLLLECSAIIEENVQPPYGGAEEAFLQKVKFQLITALTMYPDLFRAEILHLDVNMGSDSNRSRCPPSLLTRCNGRTVSQGGGDWQAVRDRLLKITPRRASAMANTTPLMTTVTKLAINPGEANTTPKVNIQEFCEEYDSERDILIHKDLPSNNTLSFAEKESFHFYIPSFSCPPAKPPDGDTGILNIKMMGDIYDQKAFMHKLMITLASDQEKSLDLLSHRGLKAFLPFATFMDRTILP
nr:hypothetical protein [Tanacetum cinerariifolium]